MIEVVPNNGVVCYASVGLTANSSTPQARQMLLIDLCHLLNVNSCEYYTIEKMERLLDKYVAVYSARV